MMHELQDRSGESALLDEALGGDQQAFEQLTAPYRRELLVHCYRILGSLEDAEDVVQETWLRAWRRLASFERRSPFRAWLYKIATHAALDALDGRRRRLLPTALDVPADPNGPIPYGHGEIRWLEPLPDSLLPTTIAAPDAAYDTRESVALAFLAAIQHLSGRQRAVLILRDVLDWQAKEVAALLDMTVAAVNSVLQRARATMKAHHVAPRRLRSSPDDARTSALLNHYVHAWDAADAQLLVSLLREDAVLTMPPTPAWYCGAAAIGAFLSTHLFVGEARGRFRLIPTRANGCPAFAAYVAGFDGVYHPSALHVLTISNGQIAALHTFITTDSRLFAACGLSDAVG